MNIVFSASNDYRMQYLSYALCAVNPNTRIWIPAQKCMNDMVHENKPELLFLHADCISDTVAESIQEFKIPFILIGLLKSKPQNLPEPLLQIGYLPPMANIVQYRKGEYKTAYQSDILYISNQPISSTDYSILSELDNSDYKFKIVGPVGINLISYVGNCNIQDMSDLIASTAILLDINQNCMYDADYNNKICMSNVKDTDNRCIYRNIQDLLTLNIVCGALQLPIDPLPIHANNTSLGVLLEISKQINNEELISNTQQLIHKLI